MAQIRTIGVLGAGLIGMSWASLFLAQGLKVVVVDPRDDISEKLRDFVADAWENLSALGLAEGDVRHATLSTDMASLSGVDYIQENGPDRIEVKRRMLRDLEDVVGPQVIIASSTSSLMASDIQRDARHPGRVLVAHPMNPPHLVPLVELVGGKQTSQGTLELAGQFYAQMGRVPVRVQKEVPGHLANRLTAALYREAVHIAAEGIADVADIDKAISAGPGMRWALMGPHLTYHLGGGAGGYRHYLDHLGPTQEARWQGLGETALSDQVKELLVNGVEAELAQIDETTLVERRDAALVKLAQLKQKFGF